MQFRNGKMYIPTDKGSLSVNGVGYLEIESDLIRLNLGITSDSKSAEEAKDKNLQTLESLITSLTDYGIPKEDINTKDISVTRNYIGCDNQQLSFIVTNLITVMIHDVSKLKDVPKGLPVIPEDMQPRFRLVNKKPVVAGNEELNANHRAHSAKLRVIERIKL